MQNKFLKLIVNLFDGDGAQSAGIGDSNGGTTTGTENNTAVRSDIKQRGTELGLSDDMLKDYQKAYDSKNKTETAGENTDNTEDTNIENADSEFEELIKGKFKNAYDKRVQTLFRDRMSKKDSKIAQLEEQSVKANQIFNIIANKYPGVDKNDINALLEAVQKDDSLFEQMALEQGVTATEAKDLFNRRQEQDAKDKELEQLRREKATSQLDARLQSLAQQTKQVYPNFDLQSEMENPDFRSALDFIAKRNSEKNSNSGKNDEIFDLTFAYEMAHRDEIQNNTIHKISKAAINAVTQNIAANSARPKENVNVRSTVKQQRSVKDMSDTEFDDLLAKIKNGTARIPRG